MLAGASPPRSTLERRIPACPRNPTGPNRNSPSSRHRNWRGGWIHFACRIDPTFDMDDFRFQVAAIMGGRAPKPSRIPAKDGEGRPTLQRGASGSFVLVVQAIIGVAADGQFGSFTEAAVRQFQRDHGLVPDGIVGSKT